MSPQTLSSNFTVPEALEAHEPPEARGLTRDGVRLLVSHLNSDQLIHARFADLPEFLRPGDLLVVNTSATLQAALTVRRSDGSQIAMHLSTHLPAGLYVVEFRKATVSAGEVFELPEGASAVALVPYAYSTRLWVARLDLAEPLLPYLQRWGHPIAYPYVRGSWPIDMYQSVYASVPGSAEMPSAGRPFTAAILDRLTLNGVFLASIVLHAGVASLEHDEPPYEEYFQVPHETIAALQRARKDNGRIIAVGTTVVRALESSVDPAGRSIASRGWTDLIITPRRGLKVVEGLLTGFHEPKSTHIALLEAIAGRPHLERVYRVALDTGYLWHEFGDLHLILPD
jgi:S-adenosylmethionine:tRNA ribosyltransferase-isomerase